MSLGLVYIMMLGVFLVILSLVLHINLAQIMYQNRLLLSTRPRGSLGIFSTAFPSVLFKALAVLFFLRSWPSLPLLARRHCAQLPTYKQVWLARSCLRSSHRQLGKCHPVYVALRFGWYNVIWRRPGPVYLSQTR